MTTNNTTDINALMYSLLTSGITVKDINNAVQSAVKRIENEKTQRAVVLLSDGTIAASADWPEGMTVEKAGWDLVDGAMMVTMPDGPGVLLSGQVVPLSSYHLVTIETSQKTQESTPEVPQEKPSKTPETPSEWPKGLTLNTQGLVGRASGRGDITPERGPMLGQLMTTTHKHNTVKCRLLAYTDNGSMAIIKLVDQYGAPKGQHMLRPLSLVNTLDGEALDSSESPSPEKKEERKIVPAKKRGNSKREETPKPKSDPDDRALQTAYAELLERHGRHSEAELVRTKLNTDQSSSDSGSDSESSDLSGDIFPLTPPKGIKRFHLINEDGSIWHPQSVDVERWPGFVVDRAKGPMILAGDHKVHSARVKTGKVAIRWIQSQSKQSVF